MENTRKPPASSATLNTLACVRLIDTFLFSIFLVVLCMLVVQPIFFCYLMNFICLFPSLLSACIR
jgi:hypothetical protein